MTVRDLRKILSDLIKKGKGDAHIVTGLYFDNIIAAEYYKNTNVLMLITE